MPKPTRDWTAKEMPGESEKAQMSCDFLLSSSTTSFHSISPFVHVTGKSNAPADKLNFILFIYLAMTARTDSVQCFAFYNII